VYIPQHFQEERPDVLARAIRDIQFALLVTAMDGDYLATHLPMALKQAGDAFTLEAHVARANEHWKVLAGKPASLAVFQGPQTYVSPSWYETKRQHGKVVPTWNYVVVHAHGRITVRDDEKFVRGVVARLTRTHEASQPVPWKMGDAPADYLDTMLQAIVGLQIEITRFVGKRKLGQNKAVEDIRGAGDALIADGKLAIGEAMLAAADAKRK